MRHPELLIPASSLEVLKVAVTFGADAAEKHLVFVPKQRISPWRTWRREFSLPMSME